MAGDGSAHITEKEEEHMDNEYLLAAQRTLTELEEAPPGIRNVRRIELAQVNATVAMALEAREANRLAREAAAHRDAANLISNAAPLKQTRHMLPRQIRNAIGKALGLTLLSRKD